MLKVVWPKVKVNGTSLLAAGNNGVEITPEYLIEWLESEPRPNGYLEGQVFIKLTYEDISKLFGNVTVTYSPEEQ